LFALIELSAEDVADLLGGVGVYNGYDFETIEFQDAEGKKVQVSRVLIKTKIPGLTIRTLPESQDDEVGRLSRALAEIRSSYGSSHSSSSGQGSGDSGQGSG
jgi:hypothetical protein